MLRTVISSFSFITFLPVIPPVISHVKGPVRSMFSQLDASPADSVFVGESQHFSPILRFTAPQKGSLVFFTRSDLH
jgi:hypothetical protein